VTKTDLGECLNVINYIFLRLARKVPYADEYELIKCDRDDKIKIHDIYLFIKALDFCDLTFISLALKTRALTHNSEHDMIVFDIAGHDEKCFFCRCSIHKIYQNFYYVTFRKVIENFAVACAAVDIYGREQTMNEYEHVPRY
jgi:hypothetical protein